MKLTALSNQNNVSRLPELSSDNLPHSIKTNNQHELPTKKSDSVHSTNFEPEVYDSKIINLSTKYHEDAKVIQSIIKDSTSEIILRKLPSDEYIDLLQLVDEYLGSNLNLNA